MTELEIEAIKAMPDSLSTFGHYITTLNGVVCCISKSGHQMKYCPTSKKWQEMEAPITPSTFSN